MWLGRFDSSVVDWIGLPVWIKDALIDLFFSTQHHPQVFNKGLLTANLQQKNIQLFLTKLFLANRVLPHLNLSSHQKKIKNSPPIIFSLNAPWLSVPEMNLKKLQRASESENRCGLRFPAFQSLVVQQIFSHLLLFFSPLFNKHKLLLPSSKTQRKPLPLGDTSGDCRPGKLTVALG